MNFRDFIFTFTKCLHEKLCCDFVWHAVNLTNIGIAVAVVFFNRKRLAAKWKKITIHWLGIAMMMVWRSVGILGHKSFILL